jgi:hypothetical protein
MLFRPPHHVDRVADVKPTKKQCAKPHGDYNNPLSRSLIGEPLITYSRRALVSASNSQSTPPLHRLEHIIKPPKYLDNFMATIKFSLAKEGVEDLTFSEVISHPKCLVMQDEYNSIFQNNTWSLVPLFFGKQAITCQWFIN